MVTVMVMVVLSRSFSHIILLQELLLLFLRGCREGKAVISLWGCLCSELKETNTNSCDNKLAFH